VLQRVEENDPKLTELNIGRGGDVFTMATDNDLSKLGAAISENTNITKLSFGIDETVKDDTNVMFINCLKQNSSIKDLHLRGNDSIGRVGHDVLKVYQDNNHLTTVRIEAQFSNRGNQVTVNTIKKCTNLKVLDLSGSGITDKQLLSIVQALKGNHVIEELNLSNLSIYQIGPCRELATLFEDPDCNIHTLNLEYNHIDKEWLIAIANGLINNTKLRQLSVDRKSVDQDVEAAFSRLSFYSSIINDRMGLEQVVFSRQTSGPSSTKVVAKEKDKGNEKIVDTNDYKSKLTLLQKQEDAWQRVSIFLLGEEVLRHSTFSTRAGSHIREILQTLLKVVKSGCCCSNVPTGCICGHCEVSIDIIRISRAVILSICKLPLELDDDITRKELDRVRSWVYTQVKEFKYDSGEDIQTILPQKLSDLITESSGTDSIPPWGEDDFALLLQQPSPSWIIRVNMLMLMGYKVILVNFNDVARFSRKNLKVVHDDISRLLCPTDNEDDNVLTIKNGLLCPTDNEDDNVLTIKNGNKGSGGKIDNDSSPTVLSREHLKIRANSIRQEFRQSGDKEKLIMSIDELLLSPNASKVIVSVNIDYAIGRGATELEAVIKMLVVLYRSRKVSKSDIDCSMCHLVESIDIYANDYPHIFDHVGRIFSSFANIQVLTFEWLADCASNVKSYNDKSNVIESAMKSVQKEYGTEVVKSCFGDVSERSALETLLGSAKVLELEAQYTSSPHIDLPDPPTHAVPPPLQTVLSEEQLRVVESMRNKWLQSSLSISKLLSSMDRCREGSAKAARMIILNNIYYTVNNECTTTDRKSIMDMFDVLYTNGRIHRNDIEAAMSDFLELILELDSPEEQHCYINLYVEIFCAFSIQMQALTITWLADSTERTVDDKWNTYTPGMNSRTFKFHVIDGAMMAILNHHGQDYMEEFDTKDRDALERVLGHSNLPYFRSKLSVLHTPKEIFGERLYPLIHRTQPKLAKQITDIILLGSNNYKLVHIIESQKALDTKIQEALKKLESRAAAQKRETKTTRDRKPKHHGDSDSDDGIDNNNPFSVLQRSSDKKVSKGSGGGSGGGGGKKNNKKSSKGNNNNKGKKKNRQK